MDLSTGVRSMCRATIIHYYDKPFPEFSYGDASALDMELEPKLLSKRLPVSPPIRTAYPVVEPQSPVYIPSVPSTNSSRTSSLRSSTRSLSSSHSVVSSSLSSAPPPPYSVGRSLELNCTSPSTVWYTPISSPGYQPQRPLRRKVSPTHDTLRNLRAKESDACLQKVCDERVFAYLNDTLFPSARTKRDRDVVDEGD